MPGYLEEIVKLQKQGIPAGITSICSASPFVVEAAMEKAKEDGTYLLIEATCNQVNQFGGYTGMRPKDFYLFIRAIADRYDFPSEKLILGGDHLGPYPWSKENASAALNKAKQMVKEYVLSGFTKIHLDASMHLGDDPGDRSQSLDASVSAARSAELCRSAEEAWIERKKSYPDSVQPVYVIGTEVPVPGGIKDESEAPAVTSVPDLIRTIELTQKYFLDYGLDEAWTRVVAVVVQPGVEFGDNSVFGYERSKTVKISEALKDIKGMVFEGHSTDYQSRKALREMVQDGIAILKVGPALTFAMREAIFLLAFIEQELVRKGEPLQSSDIINVLDGVMLKDHKHWQAYYQGSEQEIATAVNDNLGL